MFYEKVHFDSKSGCKELPRGLVQEVLKICCAGAGKVGV